VGDGVNLTVAYKELSHVRQVVLGEFPGVDLITLTDGRILGIDRDGEMRIFLYRDEKDYYDGGGECVARF
jgi:hypothetical protein